MASVLYPKAKEKFATGALSWTADTIKGVLIDLADYTYNAAHEFMTDVPGAARVGTAQTLAGKSATNGVQDANDITLPGVTGDPCEAILLYKDTGADATSPLIALIDTATGLPVTPNGGNITITWDNGANKIFAL